MSKELNLAPNMRSKNRLTAARAYIKAGLKLVVTHGIDANGRCTCGQRNCQNAGKHPISEYFPHGVKSATQRIGLVRKALEAVPDANLAASLDELTVVDIDGPEGKAHVDELNLPPTVGVKTSRGRHLYFLGSLECGTYKAEQLDVITGPKRYAMLPPSVHASGKTYRWLRTKVDFAVPVPSSLLLRSTLTRGGSKRRLLKEGARNDSLFRTMCAIRRHVDDDQTLRHVLSTINDRTCKPPLSSTELAALLQSSGRYSQEHQEDLFGPPSQVVSLPMKWLWYPYIPRYGVTILAGDPGRGKSLLIALLVGIVTSRARWPLSDERPNGRRVLLLSAEDNWARVTLHRLEKAGADVDNIHVMHKFRALTPHRLEGLAYEIEEWQPDLVVIDTLAAYMGDRDTHRQNEVGEFLARLNDMAESSGAAILAIGHLNKQSSEHPIYRIVGSIGFVASVRSALFLGQDPDDRDQLALAHGKANASVKGPTITFKIQGGGRDDTPLLQAVGLSEATEVDVCRVDRNRVGRPDDERQASIDFLLDCLSDEPVSWDRVLRAAEGRGVASEGTLNKVRTELAKSGQIVQVGKGRAAKWKLGAPESA